MAESDSARTWKQIAEKIGAIEQYTRDNEVYVGQLLDAINGLAYPVDKFDVKLANAVLCRLCTLLSACDEVLVSKCSHYVTNIVLRQEATFSEVAQNKCLKLFLSAMSSPSDGTASDILYATAAMARVHCKWKPEYMTSLVGGSSGILFKFVPPSCSLQTCRVAVNCLHAIVKHIGVGDDVMRRLVNHLLTLLETATAHSLDELQLCKFLLACHKNLITMVPNLPRDSLMATLPNLLAILKDQMYYQWNSTGQTGAALQPGKHHARQSKKKPQKFLRKVDSLSSESDQTLTDLSDSDIGSRRSEVGGVNGSRRTHLGQSRLQSSDSEHSDTESAAQWMRLQNAKVRQHACISLAAVLKQCGARTVFGYWSSFLPDTPAPPPPRVVTPTLLTLVAHDPLLHSRCAAIQVVNTIFEGSGPLLAAADDKPLASVHAFKAFSQTLGGIIKEVHCQLLSALKTERSSVTIIQLLKCLVTIVTNCPYHQLTGSYISKVIVEVCRVATFSNTDVRTASLKCFAIILSSHAPLAEVESWLLPSGGYSQTNNMSAKPLVDDEQNGKGMDVTEVPRPWVMTHCLRLFSTNECPPIQAEAIQVITALFKNYSHKVYQYCEGVYDHVVIAIMEVKARHHLLRLLEEFGRSLAAYRHQIGPSKCTEMWEGLLAGPLMLCLRETGNLVAQAIALDVMATIGDYSLQSLNHSQCMMMLSLVLNMSKDPDPGVCSSAIRTLGMFVTYSSLAEDTAFMLDASQAIMPAVAAENNLLIRTKAAWSLANLCDALPRLSDPLPNDIYSRLLQASIKACLDTDKVKSNGVRALGNLLDCMGTDQLRLCDQHIQPAMKAMAHCINIGAAKTRWNACYAARLALQSVPLCSSHSSSTVVVIAALSTVIYECKNFKVRTKASLALCSLQRCCIVSSAHLAELLTAVIKALQCSDTLTDFSEYKHCASLKQQLCTALCHLTSQLIFEDVPEVSKTLTPLFPVVQQYLEETLRSTNSLESHTTGGPNSKGEEDGASAPSIEVVATSALKHLLQLRDNDDDTAEESKQFLRELTVLFDKSKYTRKEVVTVPVT